MSADNVAILQDLLTSLNDPQRRSRAWALIAPDFVGREAASLPFGGEYRGPDALRTLLKAVNATFIVEVKSMQLHDAGDTVIADVSAELAHRVTTRVLRTRIIELYTIRDGLISELDVFYQDTAAVLALAERVGP